MRLKRSDYNNNRLSTSCSRFKERFFVFDEQNPMCPKWKSKGCEESNKRFQWKKNQRDVIRFICTDWNRVSIRAWTSFYIKIAEFLFLFGYWFESMNCHYHNRIKNQKIMWAEIRIERKYKNEDSNRKDVPLLLLLLLSKSQVDVIEE